jgi:hypothetical protein
LAEWERELADRPVHFFHLIQGENSVQAVDFQKHYRSEAGYLLDTDYAVAKAYKAMGWPTYVCVDAEGKISGRWLGLGDKNGPEARKTLEAALAKATGGPPKGAFCTGTICVLPSDKDNLESEATMAADQRGRAHLVFVRQRGSGGDLLHRTWDAQKWSDPQPITRVAADHYSPSLCQDAKDGLWLVWCSNQAASGKYDVWAVRYDGEHWAAPMQVTQSNDDAAHPRAAVDSQGNLWVTYYRWIPWRHGLSRDREIFVRRYDGKTWSDETQVSPTDVPRYEDHTDPSIAADGQGNAWVAWVWDTHPEKNWAYAPTFGQTVFARRLRADGELQPLEMVAVRAASMRAAKNQPTWAFAPELTCRQDQPWFLFAAHEPNGGAHAALLTARSAAKEYPAPTRLGTDPKLICTPRFVEDRDGKLYAIWSAPVAGHFAVKLAALGAGGQWGEERVVWQEDGKAGQSPAADLRFPVGAFDANHRLHLAAVRISLGGAPGEEQAKNEVAVKEIDVTK